jgi:hypothetical protein
MGTVPFNRKNHKHNELRNNRTIEPGKNSRMMGGQFPSHFSRVVVLNKIKADFNFVHRKFGRRFNRAGKRNATESGAPTELRIMVGLVFYKYFAPAELPLLMTTLLVGCGIIPQLNQLPRQNSMTRVGIDFLRSRTIRTNMRLKQ